MAREPPRGRSSHGDASCLLAPPRQAARGGATGGSAAVTASRVGPAWTVRVLRGQCAARSVDAPRKRLSLSLGAATAPNPGTQRRHRKRSAPRLRRGCTVPLGGPRRRRPPSHRAGEPDSSGSLRLRREPRRSDAWRGPTRTSRRRPTAEHPQRVSPRPERFAGGVRRVCLGHVGQGSERAVHGAVHARVKPVPEVLPLFCE